MWCVLGLCRYETNKLVRIQSVRLGTLRWALNALILVVICIMMMWNRNYQQVDLVVSSVTTKVKGVAQIHLPGLGDMVWDVVDYSGQLQQKNSFFVATNIIVTKNQKQGKCPEVPSIGRLCRSDEDCQKGASGQQSNGIQTGSCVRFDVLRKTCEVSAWCPIEARNNPPRPALLAAAENFTVLIKNNIRFPAFNYTRRNILPHMNATYLQSCQRSSDPLCPIFKLGHIVKEAGESFAEMAVEGGVIGILIQWDCNLDRLMQRCRPKYTFRRLDEKESNRTLYPGLNFRYAKYWTIDGVEQRTLYKAYGIRFDVMVFGQAGKFCFIHLLIYIGSTLSYYALTTLLIDWLIQTSCYSAELGHSYSQRKVEEVQDEQKCVLCVSYVDEKNLRLVKRSKHKCLQNLKPISVEPRKENSGHLMGFLFPPPPVRVLALESQSLLDLRAEPELGLGPAWCCCARCTPSLVPEEQLCCRQTVGACLTSSPVFEQLVLQRTLLEAILLYRDPLAPPTDEAQTGPLRDVAYEQYIRWRFGVPHEDAHPTVPSCCLRRIWEAFPSHKDTNPNSK